MSMPQASKSGRPARSPATRSVCICLLYTSDAADERSSVDLGGRRIIKKKKTEDNQDEEHDYKIDIANDQAHYTANQPKQKGY